MQIENKPVPVKDSTTPKQNEIKSKLEEKVDSINNKETEPKNNQTDISQIKTGKKRTAFEQQFYF